ncbi:hypothetical protein J2S62_000403 [Enteractinococcus fodinae]|uniref:Uncharacterized protein n=1 Tax=Enteractinococcus fodinae TaxID=684663 RepID=A0ABU2AXR9_9MICC|nr:hypothetical protein [Enteractinococcus fodinae]
MFEKAETYWIEGIRLRIQRRAVGVVDIEFIDAPQGSLGASPWPRPRQRQNHHQISYYRKYGERYCHISMTQPKILPSRISSGLVNAL